MKKTAIKQLLNIISSYLSEDLQDLDVSSGQHKITIEIADVRKDFGKEYKFDNVLIKCFYNISSEVQEDTAFLSFRGCYSGAIYLDGVEVDESKPIVMFYKEVENRVSHLIS